MVQINPNRYVTPRAPEVFELRRPTWQHHALCHGRMPEFFAEYMSKDKAAELKALCAKCTVRHECLEFALGFEVDRDAIYGGHTVAERAAIRAARFITEAEKGA